VLKCAGARRITEEDETRYAALLRNANILYGRLGNVFPFQSVGLQYFGRYFDAFQYVLCQSSLTSIFRPTDNSDFWHQLWATASSALAQSIGRAEEAARQSKPAVSPEVVTRWRPVISALESGRLALCWLSSRPRFLGAIVARLEGSPWYRAAAAVTTFGSLIALGGAGMAVVVSGLAWLLG